MSYKSSKFPKTTGNFIKNSCYNYLTVSEEPPRTTHLFTAGFGFKIICN